MMDDNRQGPGCITTLVAILGIIGILLALAGGGDDKRPNTNTNTTPVLSGNEVFSRNQGNLFSDVTNEFYDCMGAGACVFTTDNSTSTDTRATTTVTGDRNVIVGSDGTQLCQDPSTGIYSACQ
jgi:hypothetical protein